MPAEFATRVYGGELVTRRRELRRRQFLDAGLEVFGTQGYRDSSITLICRTARLARAQFYEHFFDREELLLAVHEMVQADALAAMRPILAQAGRPPLERVSEAMRAYAVSVGSDPRRARISFVEIVGVSDRIEQRRDARRAEWTQIIQEEVRAVMGPDHVPPGGYEFAATGFIGSLTAMVHRWSESEPRSPIDDLADTLALHLVVLMGIER